MLEFENYRSKLILEFRNWLINKGYTKSTAYSYSKEVDRIIREIGLYATEDEIKDFLRNLNYYTRTNYVTAWNRFKEFLDGGVCDDSIDI